ncbi:MAG: hypothetical protein JWO36_1759 [Myxococcales bacterium]|nr:hypothetical protein [Myxococcales bacterium]
MNWVRIFCSREKSIDSALSGSISEAEQTLSRGGKIFSTPRR